MVQNAERIASFARLIWFDKRGIGMSDRTASATQPLEERIDDVRAVLDAARSERATFVAIHEAGPMAILYAAAHPERINGLVLYGTWPKGTRSEDYPWAPPQDYHQRVAAAIKERWGTGMSARTCLRVAPETNDFAAGSRSTSEWVRAPGQRYRLPRPRHRPTCATCSSRSRSQR